MPTLAKSLYRAEHFPIFALCHFLNMLRWQHETFPTVSIVKELSDVEGTAGRPGRGLVEADKQWSHQVMSSQISEQPLTGLGVVVGHTQHMTCSRRGSDNKNGTLVGAQAVQSEAVHD